MNNTAERDRFIAEKLSEGLSLSEVQKLLDAELNVKMTYLDLRLLAADLEVDWDKHDVSQDDAGDEKDARPSPSAEDLLAEEPGIGKTQISVSKLVRPGMAMSGDVVFASGAKAEWFVDAMGRLGLNPAEGSTKPTPEDIQEFQVELQRALSGGAH